MLSERNIFHKRGTLVYPNLMARALWPNVQMKKWLLTFLFSWWTLLGPDIRFHKESPRLRTAVVHFTSGTPREQILAPQNRQCVWLGVSEDRPLWKECLDAGLPLFTSFGSKFRKLEYKASNFYDQRLSWYCLFM